MRHSSIQGEHIMQRSWLIALTIVACAGPLLAQQRAAPAAGVAIDQPDVVAEVKTAYDRYNDAVNSGNIVTMNATFHDDPRTIRYGGAENLYGYNAIEHFRAAAQPLNPPRTLAKTVITT